LLVVGGLLVLALVPLFFAVASLARASLLQVSDGNASALGRAVAGHVIEARRSRDAASLAQLLAAQTGSVVGALAVYDAAGKRIAGAGDVLAALPQQLDVAREQAQVQSLPRGRAMRIVVAAGDGAVAVLIHTDPQAARVQPLTRLVGLYTGLLGLALLVFIYLVLTRVVVRPIDELSHAARRVADGMRQLSVPRIGARELSDLGSSLAAMTTTMRAEEEQLREKVEELEAAHAQISEAQDSLVRSERLASVGRLAAGLAHEIGNPISAIMGFQELMLAGELSPKEERDFLERMKRETDRVNKVLRDLLDFARPAARSLEGKYSEPPVCSLREVVEHVLALVRPQPTFVGVEVSSDIPPALPAVGMQRVHVEQVLLNLLLNAADAVSQDDARVWLRAECVDDTLRLTVEDSGGGIEPSVRARLFEPFVTTKEVGKGTGLGLAVCRGLIEAAGGHIDVEDGDAGARFVLILPRTKLRTSEP
jgi:signal transduction histidine kinase